MSVTTLLRAAAAEHDAVTIAYDDGESAQVLTIVIPVAVHGEYLEAIADPTTNVRKLFKISNIAVARCAGGRFAYNPTICGASSNEPVHA